jgi:hypothetical protein
MLRQYRPSLSGPRRADNLRTGSKSVAIGARKGSFGIVKLRFISAGAFGDIKSLLEGQFEVKQANRYDFVRENGWAVFSKGKTRDPNRQKGRCICNT